MIGFGVLSFKLLLCVLKSIIPHQMRDKLRPFHLDSSNIILTDRSHDWLSAYFVVLLSFAR